MKLSKKKLEQLLILADQGASTNEHRNLVHDARRALLGPAPKERTPAQKGKRSRTKGQVGEREWCLFLREEGLFPEAQRGWQARGGGKEEADIQGTGPFHFEVKRCEALSLYAAMKQAQEDSGAYRLTGVAEVPTFRIPVVPHRRNDHPWLVVMLATDWAELIRRSDLLDSATSQEVCNEGFKKVRIEGVDYEL